MNPNYLDFEQPIAELEMKIEELKSVVDDSEINISDEIDRLKAKSHKLTQSIYNGLSPWDIVRVARHPLRPYTMDYIPLIFDEFDELHGDRHFGDDKAIVGGVARLDGKPVMVIGQEKGRAVKDKVYRNFGMPKPEGYRKALRLMEMAERFNMPVVTLIDTPGAYPGIDSEERGISEAIAQNLAVMSRLKTPIVCVVIGEGSSGGALGIGVGDHLAMLQYSTYFVISPEGCAAILWSDGARGPEAAEALKLTAMDIDSLGVIIDDVIPEPLGGAHNDHAAAAATVKEYLKKHLEELKQLSPEELVEQRYQKFRAMSVIEE